MFLTFAGIGGFTFGGGYAMLPDAAERGSQWTPLGDG